MIQANELKHLLKIREGLKTSLGLRVQPIFPFCVGPDGFTLICPCPHEVKVYKVRSTRVAHITWKEKFVACKIPTTYGQDLSLEGGVVLYVQVF